MYQIIHRIGRVSDGHHAFEERSCTTVTAVTAVAEYDGALQLARAVASFARAVPHGVEISFLCTAAFELECSVVRAFEHGGYIVCFNRKCVWPRCCMGLAPLPASIVSLEYTVFQVGGNPRTVSLSWTAPVLVASEVDAFHSSRAVIVTGRFCVSVVETAKVVIVLAVNHHVHGFFFVAGGYTFGVVIAVTGSGPGVAIEPVSLAPADVNRGPVGVRFFGSIFKPIDWRRFLQIVLVAALVVNDGNGAFGACTKIVLHGGFDKASRLFDRNVLGLPIGSADLIEVPAVAGVECTCQAVSGDAWCFCFCVDVARTFVSIRNYGCSRQQGYNLE